MSKVGLSPEQRDAVLATVAAVLHLGNVAFVDGKEPDSSAVAPGTAIEHLKAAGVCGKLGGIVLESTAPGP
jgi:myosin V